MTDEDLVEAKPKGVWRLETKESTGHEVQHLKAGKWTTWMIFGHGQANELAALKMIEVGSTGYQRGFADAKPLIERALIEEMMAEARKTESVPAEVGPPGATYSGYAKVPKYPKQVRSFLRTFAANRDGTG